MKLTDEVTALLWDLDNVTTRCRHLPHLAKALATIAGTHTPKVAAGRRSTALKWEPLLTELGFETESGGKSKSGADRKLLLRARHLHELGVRSFMVASNDGDLAGVAKWGDLHVVTLNRAHVSLRLTKCASSILVLAPETSSSGPAAPPESDIEPRRRA